MERLRLPPSPPSPRRRRTPALRRPAPSGVDLEGITIKYAKAPHGEDEAELTEQWLQPFKDATGAEIEHTIVPWDQLEALYTANFAGDDVFDVMYQVSTHLTLFGEQGNFEDVTAYIAGEDWASERAHFSDAIINPSVYNDKLYGVPFIIGTIVKFDNLDLMKGAGMTPPDDRRGSHRGRQGGDDRRRLGLLRHPDHRGLRLVLQPAERPQLRRRHHLRRHHDGHDQLAAGHRRDAALRRPDPHREDPAAGRRVRP